MLTGSEKKYFALTALFLLTGTGVKAYRNALVRIGPMPSEMRMDSSRPRPAMDSGEAVLAQPPSMATESASIPAENPSIVTETPSVATESGSSLENLARGTPLEATPEGLSERAVPTRKSPFVGKIKLNRAGAAELATLKGIGEKTARAIVAYREAHGPFRNTEELKRIKGIGEKKLEGMRPNLTVEPL